MTQRFSGYLCPECTAHFPPTTAPRYRCDQCGCEALDVALDFERRPPDRDRIDASTDRSLWRYAELLPVASPSEPTPLRTVGGTPMHRALRLRGLPRAAEVWIKDDGALPTGSLKDRASAVVVMRSKQLGMKRLITASTGNAGVAIAAMARAAGLKATVLVPESAPPAKLAQLLIFGAELFLVRGNYDAAFRLSREAATKKGWYCRNTAYNPFTVEGKKTVAFEICQAFNWQPPERIYVAVGDGNIISGIYKGLSELHTLGWITRLPRLFGVQAKGSAAIAKAFEQNLPRALPVQAKTLADSIAADQPADSFRALRAVRDTGGAYLEVSDEAILEAMVALGRDAAIFGEPAACAAYAGLLSHLASGDITSGETVVVVNTGNGLKDVAAASRAACAPPIVEATLSDLERAMSQQEKR